MAITKRPPSVELAPGAQAHHEIQLAYDFFNQKLFGGNLPPCFISFQRKGSRVRGYFSPNRLATADGRSADEIALNPRRFKNRPFIAVMSTLVHEMVHQWQQHFGAKRGRLAYHDREFGGEMLRLGLYPSHTGEPGGRMTGQTMSHYVIPGGRFEIAANELRAMLPALTWFDAAAPVELPKGLTGSGLLPSPPLSGRRTVYRCLGCQDFAEGKSTLQLICGKCDQEMPPHGHR